MVENYDVTTVIVDETVATTIPNTDLEALKTAFNDIKKLRTSKSYSSLQKNTRIRVHTKIKETNVKNVYTNN